jgi:hypothetical protein
MHHTVTLCSAHAVSQGCACLPACRPHHVAHGADCVGGPVRGVLLDDPAYAQVGKLGHHPATGAAAHQHVARIL